MTEKCTLCGHRRGLHRWGDEACPNLPLRPGSGRPHWLQSMFTQAVGAALMSYAQSFNRRRA